jgi:hypothetical protein
VREVVFARRVAQAGLAELIDCGGGRRSHLP